MKERPILFSGPMIRAILEGKKTVTRRIVKFPAHADPAAIASVNPDGKNGWIAWGPSPVSDDYSRWHYPDGGGFTCPYGEPGDRLWVRETWKPTLAGDSVAYYRATFDPGIQTAVAWKPSIFMPRWASRITLDVIGVRVARLQDITPADMQAEGIDCLYDGDQINEHYTRQAWVNLWDGINAARGYSWESNPWIWRVEFRKVQP